MKSLEALRPQIVQRANHAQRTEVLVQRQTGLRSPQGVEAGLDTIEVARMLEERIQRSSNS